MRPSRISSARSKRSHVSRQSWSRHAAMLHQAASRPHAVSAPHAASGCMACQIGLYVYLSHQCRKCCVGTIPASSLTSGHLTRKFVRDNHGSGSSEHCQRCCDGRYVAYVYVCSRHRKSRTRCRSAKQKNRQATAVIELGPELGPESILR